MVLSIVLISPKGSRMLSLLKSTLRVNMMALLLRVPTYRSTLYLQ